MDNEKNSKLINKIMNEKMMEEGHEYFSRQEEDISNKYMSANGKNEQAPPKLMSRPQNSLLSWECNGCQGFDIECYLLCKGKKILIWGVIAYVGYRVFIKKK